MSLSVRFKYICRTCLRPLDADISVSLHKVIELENSEALKLAELIEECIGLQILETDNNTSSLVICEECTRTITNFYLFRIKCIKNCQDFIEQYDYVDVKSEVKVENCDWPETELDSTDDPFRDNFSSSEHPNDLEINQKVSNAVLSLDQVTQTVPNVSKDSLRNISEETESLINKTPENEVDPADILFYDYSSSEHEDESIENDLNKSEIESIVVQKTHECDICFASFETRKNLVDHRREKHLHEISKDLYTAVKKGTLTHYICNICKHFCRHKDGLRVHLRSHTGEKPYKCSICSESFTQKCAARKHMETIHNSNSQKNPIDKNRKVFYRCELCNKGFQNEFKLKLHYEEEHPDNQTRNYVSVIPNGVEQLCDICGKFMKCLSAHLRAHSGTKQFECHICGKHLATASSLYQHRQRHSDEKNYICDTCGKKFKLKHDLTFHRKIHNQVRKHACHLCDQKFLLKVGLRIHLRAHAGERPYQAHNDRKRERRRLKRLEMIENGIPFPKRKPRKKKVTKPNEEF